MCERQSRRADIFLKIFFIQHKKLRCCTFSRPYFLGPGSVRLHRVPESAIPCYFYQKLCKEAENQVYIENEKSENFANNCLNADKIKRNEIFDKLNAPGIKIKVIICFIIKKKFIFKTADDILNAQFTPDELYNYAKKRIKFKNICVYRFGKWQEARNFYKTRKRNSIHNRSFSTLTEENVERPGLKNLKINI